MGCHASRKQDGTVHDCLLRTSLNCFSLPTVDRPCSRPWTDLACRPLPAASGQWTDLAKSAPLGGQTLRAAPPANCQTVPIGSLGIRRPRTRRPRTDPAWSATVVAGQTVRGSTTVSGARTVPDETPRQRDRIARLPRNIPVTLPLPTSLVLVEPPATSVAQLFAVIAGRASRLVGGLDPQTLRQLLIDRELTLSTATPEGIAFPHAIDPRLERTLIGVARLAPPLRFGTAHPPCRYAFFLFGSGAEPWRHVRLLARIARVVLNPSTRADLDSAENPSALRRCLLDAEARLV